VTYLKYEQPVGGRPPMCLGPLQVDNIFVFYSPGGTCSGMLAI